MGGRIVNGFWRSTAAMIIQHPVHQEEPLWTRPLLLKMRVSWKD
jgi:hypothetical protein